jgi:rhodanese-related sulfurtransferase
MRTLITILFFIVNVSCHQEIGNAQVIVVNADSMKTLMNNKTNVILDVRTPEEFAEGHLKGAININYHDENFQKGIDSLKKDVTYLVYCRSGRRSEEASLIMLQNGFKKIYNYHDGILEWEEKENEIVK